MAGIDALAMACHNPACNFQPMPFKRRPLGEYDVHIGTPRLHRALGHALASAHA